MQRKPSYSSVYESEQDINNKIYKHIMSFEITKPIFDVSKTQIIKKM